MICRDKIGMPLVSKSLKIDSSDSILCGALGLSLSDRFRNNKEYLPVCLGKIGIPDKPGF